MTTTNTTRSAHNLIAPGTRVTCEYRMEHVGIALAVDDPAAWEGSCAFYGRAPTREDVAAHVAWCEQSFGPMTSQPVRWPWGIMWDRKLSAA